MKTELSITNRLANVEPDIALDAVYKALTKIYENKGAKGISKSHRYLNKQRHELRSSKRPTGFSTKHSVVGAQQRKEKSLRTNSTLLASRILREIETAEKRPIREISSLQIGRYAGALVGFTQDQMLARTKTDRDSIEKVKRELASVEL